MMLGVRPKTSTPSAAPNKETKKKEPDVEDFVLNRDYVGAQTLLEVGVK